MQHAMCFTNPIYVYFLVSLSLTASFQNSMKTCIELHKIAYGEKRGEGGVDVRLGEERHGCGGIDAPGCFRSALACTDKPLSTCRLSNESGRV